ncbi:hypothetical protein DP43_4059 [Burkholderia pseudomallei]|nr:hypothetical protein DP43_4059 [Burkholderia pseudomallei]
MLHVQNLNYFRINAVHNNIVVMHHHLSRSGNAPRSIQPRANPQPLCLFTNHLHQGKRSIRIVLPNKLQDTQQVCLGHRPPLKS